MTSIFSISIWRTLHQGGHSMGVSEVCTYGGHLSKRTVVPAVYILEKVMTWDWTTAGTNPKCPFWEEAFLIDACKPEVKHFSSNMPWSYQIGILKCRFCHRNDLLKMWSKSHPKIAKRLLPVDLPRRSSWCYTRRFATTIFSATLLWHCCDIVSNSYNIVPTLQFHALHSRVTSPLTSLTSFTSLQQTENCPH